MRADGFITRPREIALSQFPLAPVVPGFCETFNPVLIPHCRIESQMYISFVLNATGKEKD